MSKSSSKTGSSKTKKSGTKKKTQENGSKKKGTSTKAKGSTATKASKTAKKSTATTSAARSDIGDRVPRGGTKTYQAPSRTILIVWMLVGAELILDVVTTIISFVVMMQESTCCGEELDLGALPLAITIPFFVLILAELCMLAMAIKQYLFTSRAQMERQAAARAEEDETSCTAFLGKTFYQKMMNGLLLLNPFFGFLVAWLLLYQSNKNESLIVLGLEGASLLLHFLSIYLEGNKQTRGTIAVHCLPIIPFLATLIVILVYLQVGGVCYLVEDTLFWYEGCHVCSDGTLPVDGVCPDGTEGNVQSYCSEETSFCWFPYGEE